METLLLFLGFGPLIVTLLLFIAVLWKRHVEGERQARIADALERSVARSKGN